MRNLFPGLPVFIIIVAAFFHIDKISTPASTSTIANAFSTESRVGFRYKNSNRDSIRYFPFLLQSQALESSEIFYANTTLSANVIDASVKNLKSESSRNARRVFLSSAFAILNTVSQKSRNLFGKLISEKSIVDMIEDDEHEVAMLAATQETKPGRRIVEFKVNNLDGIRGNIGTFNIQLRPEWAPRGVQRFKELTSASFWDGCRVFRVLPGVVSQFGINGDPNIQSRWRSSTIPDDPVRASNTRGTVVFTTNGGPNTRTTQLFINTGENGNEFLDRQGFAPIGHVSEEDMKVVDRFYSWYGETKGEKGPIQGLIQKKGNIYLKSSFPKLTYMLGAEFVDY